MLAVPEWRTIPTPLFLVDPTLSILDANLAARRVFELSESASFTDLLDPGSLTKASRMLNPEAVARHAVELNMRPREGGTVLFDVQPAWHDNGQGWLLCHPKSVELDRIESMVSFISRQLKEDDAPGMSPSYPAPAPARFTRSGKLTDAQSSVTVALELLELLRSDMIELHKEDFLNVIISQLRAVVDGRD
ncbi:hypothetical protein FHS18_000625 [Paenibacillus phyllosphaerae]|uniref:PAS fold-4 domain-containing protein n=1 Tax=Paenibacillus phyllosphaerae TaxID=274593 RepID=A0A7W5FL42_9BACL|nr:hypothetical protein [Paenibacillus phyllosphaerae]MBB3108597.1 hypothetical protein [Paenibacillus phyllosphaerae]